MAQEAWMAARKRLEGVEVLRIKSHRDTLLW
jgi:hypothetical protein